jgi:predicted DNA-binding protein (MmcQ/YjbR family)
MNIETIREYCLMKKGVSEEFPFNETTLVFKVMNKMFLLASLDSVPLSINLKCDPETAVELREKYDSVEPAFHMNKTHWNSVIIDGTIPDKEILAWIDDSYSLVVDGLKKSDKEKLKRIN